MTEALEVAAHPNAWMPDAPRHPGMIRIPGGTFRMGADRHYRQGASARLVTVDAFRIDRTPVTNRRFETFVRATGYVTLLEIPQIQEITPGALPHMPHAGAMPAMPSRLLRP
jgi:formylglycine-generating enzyme required for sulfatase activity